MEFKTTLSKFFGKDASVYELHLPVPKPIAEQFIRGENRRIICEINQTTSIRSGLMPHKDYWYILLNQAVIKKLGLAIGNTVTVKLSPDDSTYGMDMPEELMILLDQDPEGNEYFHQLTPGKQRNLIYIVSKVKSPESRLNKALAIVHHLKERNGKLDFKLLNEVIKDYNQRGKLN